MVNKHQQDCNEYLNGRTGKYEWRRVRYLAALRAMQELGLRDSDTVVDIGAGWTEFDYCLRTDGKSRCRYHPVDGGLDGTDLNKWRPPQEVDFFVCLEILEHLDYPGDLVLAMQEKCRKGIIVSVPNPRTTNVLGMDPTHHTEIKEISFIKWGFHNTMETSFYGQPNDSIFAVWQKTRSTRLPMFLEAARQHYLRDGWRPML